MMRTEQLKEVAKRVLCLLLVVSLPILPGCWDRKELNEIALIRAIGIDRTEDGQIEVTLLQAIPHRVGTKEAGGKQRVLAAKSLTIPEAKDMLQQKMARKIFVGHQEVIVLGKRLAKKGIREALDYVARQPQVRQDALVFVSQGSPKEIIETIPPLEFTSSETLYKMVKLERTADVTVMRVLKEMNGDGEATSIPVVEKMGEKSLGLNGVALFRGDKMVKHLERKAKEGLLWLKSELTSGIVTTRIKGEKGYISLEVSKVDTQMIPKIEGKNRRILLKISAEDEVVFNGTRLSLHNPANLDRISRAMERDIRERIRWTVKKAQKARADVFNFAGAFHRKYPKEWAKMKNHWNERVFPRLQVDVQARVFIRQSGVVNEPLTKPTGTE